MSQGPLIDESSLAKVEELVTDARSKGARVVTGSKRHALGRTFYEPTILVDITPDIRMAREEIFGPINRKMTASAGLARPRHGV